MGLIAELVHYEYGPDEYLIAQLINQWHLSRQIYKEDKIFLLRLLVNVSRTSGFRFNVVIYNNLFKAFGALQEKEMLKAVYEEAKAKRKKLYKKPYIFNNKSIFSITLGFTYTPLMLYL